ncbi:hypothetical protein EIP86_006614 [Pleurotus ostreatoroseus]|nr:hypothetical protein EIP86_006614 [Pleurotus ostreatoroseus]
MWSILTQRTALRTTGLLAASFTKSRAPLFASVNITRSFLTTPRLAYPETKKSAKTTAVKEKKTAVKKPAAKKKVAAKKPAKKVKKVATKPAAKRAPKVNPEDKPPKRPLGPYFLFIAKYMQDSGFKAKSVAEQADYSKKMGEIWRGMSDADKQPYMDAASKEMNVWLATMEEYRKNVSLDVVRQINKQRTKAGKRRILVRKSGKPPSAFLMYHMDRLNAAKAQNPSVAVGTLMLEVSKEAAVQWRAASDDVKAPYIERYNKLREAWLKEKTAAQQA